MPPFRVCVGVMALPVGPKISPLSSAGVWARVWQRACAGSRQDGVHPVPQPAIDNGLVLARIGRALVHRLADIDPVVEQLVDVALVDQLALLAPDIFGPQRAHRSVADRSRTKRSKIIRTVAAFDLFPASVRSLT